jgi:hypothetical protein
VLDSFQTGDQIMPRVLSPEEFVQFEVNAMREDLELKASREGRGLTAAEIGKISDFETKVLASKSGGPFPLVHSVPCGEPIQVF